LIYSSNYIQVLLQLLTLDHWLIMVSLMMETHVTSEAHCLSLQLDPVMVNLACFMVSNGCHQRSAFSLH